MTTIANVSGPAAQEGAARNSDNNNDDNDDDYTPLLHRTTSNVPSEASVSVATSILQPDSSSNHNDNNSNNSHNNSAAAPARPTARASALSSHSNGDHDNDDDEGSGSNNNNNNNATRASRHRNAIGAGQEQRPEQLQRQQQQQQRKKRQQKSKPVWWKLWSFLSMLALDALLSLLLLTPWVPGIPKAEGLDTSRYTLHASLWDISFLAIPRILAALLAVTVSYFRRVAPPSSPFELYHPNGDKKSKAELEAESLEEPYGSMFRRYVLRIPFVCELCILVTGILLSVKCMARLNVEIGVYNESHPKHPIFWLAISVTSLLALLEVVYLEPIEALAGELGRARRQRLMTEPSSASTNWLERMGETLTQPLLTPLSSSRVQSETNLLPPTDTVDVEHGSLADTTQETGGSNKTTGVDAVDPANARAVSDIGADADYSANWTDLFAICEPDLFLLVWAGFFLLAAAVANILVPKFTGAVLDALVEHANNRTLASYMNHNVQLLNYGNEVSYLQDDGRGSIMHIPGFLRNIYLLVSASILAGIFGGIRGAIFTLVGARVNTRLRIRLMDALLAQDIGFFDTTRTGDITSRLSSDTTLVGSSITASVSIFLRSIVRAVGVLIFMFTISWQLSMLAFLTIPAVSILSRWYGRYIRKISKLQQKKLAEGNSVSEASMSSMGTVRTFGAESVELYEFEKCMQKYLDLNIRNAILTLGYSTCVNAMPELVKALVPFYGGLLVQTDGPDHISGGQLVSFILYLTSLSEAFNSLGGIYASLVRAVGAADKVFELMHRTPRITVPRHVDPERMERVLANRKNHLLGVESKLVVKHCARGLYPGDCKGEITFRDVEARYPARPMRVVLDGLNLHIQPGSIVALVGTSGSGKSSIVKLIQHLYEPSKGEICIDGIPVQEISADWICRNVAVVSQEPTLFARSVKQNIMYGLEGTDAEPSQEEIEEAARLANAASFIEALPQGYDTEVGERGIQLSGGQKQRVAIARALVRRPKILLLDEATSALDSESEYVVQSAIDDMISGQRSLDGDPSRSMTVVIVAHRLSTVRNADCIFVIQNGKVAEQGSHDELAAKPDGVYSALIRRQLGQVDDDGSESKP